MWVGHRTYYVPEDFYKLSSFTAVVQTIFLARISTEHIPMLDRELIVFDMISINRNSTTTGAYLHRPLHRVLSGSTLDLDFLLMQVLEGA